MVARYAANEWRSRVFALRYVVSFGASALAVPLVAVLHRSSGGFQQVFVVLAAIALCTLAASFLLPSPASEREAAEAMAQPAGGDD
jgi:hypothetical protein